MMTRRTLEEVEKFCRVMSDDGDDLKDSWTLGYEKAMRDVLFWIENADVTILDLNDEKDLRLWEMAQEWDLEED